MLMYMSSKRNHFINQVAHVTFYFPLLVSLSPCYARAPCVAAIVYPGPHRSAEDSCLDRMSLSFMCTRKVAYEFVGWHLISFYSWFARVFFTMLFLPPCGHLDVSILIRFNMVIFIFNASYNTPVSLVWSLLLVLGGQMLKRPCV